MAVETRPARARRRSFGAVLLRRFPRLPAMVVLAGFVLLLNLPTLHVVNTVSDIDEREHIDLMLRGSHFRIGHNGQVLTQETLRELCTRGSESVRWPMCTPGRLDPAAFNRETNGVNNSAQDPPYYVVTGLTARALRALTPGPESLVTWARVLGSVWLLAGMYAAIRLGDLIGVSRKHLVVALVLFAAIPTQLQASTTVNPDAVAFLAGAGILLAAVAWEKGKASVAWLVAASALALWVDRANVVAVLIALVYLAFRVWAGARGEVPGAPSWQRFVAAGVAVGVGSIALVGTWQVTERRLRPEQTVAMPASARPKAVHGFPVKRTFEGKSIFGILPPLTDAAPPGRRDPLHATWYQTAFVAAFLLVIGTLGAALLARSGPDRIRLLAAATIIGLILAPPLMHLYNYYVNGYFTATVPRFGLSALPSFALLMAAVTSRSRVGRVVLPAVAVGLYTTALLTLT